MSDPFADDVLERLARSNRDYQRSHGEYIIPLATLLLSARRDLDRAIVDIGVAILALRACDEAREPVPSRLRAHIRVLEDEWFNLPTSEGAARREMLDQTRSQRV